jgi:enoyl-CoA hydratase/carnithine racemase
MDPVTTDRIRVHVAEGIGWLTLDNPERRNAISLDMWRGIGAAVEAFQHDDAVRVAVIRGAGGKAFASGADISEFDRHRANAEQGKEYTAAAALGHEALRRFDKPLLALIEGFCIGGGLVVALCADVRFATPASRFAIPAARLGLGYEYSGVATLARLIGPSAARDLLFSARLVEADEALRLGLINFIVAGDDIEARVRDYAQVIAANAPLTIRAAKAAVAAFEDPPLTDAAAARVRALVDACFDSADYAEGRRAFAEKRPPRFQGR